MRQRCETATIETLLEHAEWVRGLAGHLVRDDPDDAVQESWLAAMRSPPDADRPARPWLARVLQNVTRKRFRERCSLRGREEKAGALRDEVPTPATLLERAQTSRLLGELVLGLDEPFREVVLLRYYEGLSSAQIARIQGIPAGTVRWRLKEAMGRLREVLDEKHGGDRNAWCLVLAAPTPLAKSAALATGVAAMSLGSKAAIAGAVALLAAVLASVSSTSPAAPPVAPPPQRLEAGAPAPVSSPRKQASTPRAEKTPSAPLPAKATPKPGPEPRPDPAPPALRSLTPAEKVRRRHAAEDALDIMLDGPTEPEPIEWPNDVPEAYRPENFRKTVLQILNDCSVPAELVKVECDEPPCIAALRLGDEPAEREILGDCPLWQETYGGRHAITQSHKTVACADESTERAAFVYRFWPAIYQKHGGTMLRRLGERVRQLRDHWECLP